MTITRADAIEAARNFRQRSEGQPWDETTLNVSQDEVDGRRAWLVKACDPLPPAHEAWMHIIWPPVSYFVDRDTGEFFGFATERDKTIFPEGSKWVG